MKTLNLASLLVGFAALSAHAGVIRTEYVCSQTPSVPDHTLQVTVMNYFGSRVGVPTEEQTSYTVNVSEYGVTGLEKNLGSYHVEKIVTGMPGAPVSYVGQGLTLNVQMTVTPRADHMFPGTLTIEQVDGATLSVKLLCK